MTRHRFGGVGRVKMVVCGGGCVDSELSSLGAMVVVVMAVHLNKC
jgi:hypothetical protein